jgi:hypothetical protein
MSIGCLKNVIGLTRTTAEVHTENLGTNPAADWYKESVSGLFLDELPGIVQIKTVEQSLPDQTELSKYYQESLESAKTELRDDLIVGISKRYQQSAKIYKGPAGGTSFSGNSAVGGSYAGIWIRTADIRGGKIKIVAINGMFSTPPTNLKLYRMPAGIYSLEFVKDIPVVFTPNAATKVTLATAEEMDMDGYDYALLYQNTGISPKNNNISCGCGHSESLMKRYINLVGVNGTDLNEVNAWSQTQTANGLSLDVEVGCSTGNILCELYESAEVMKTVISHCVRYKAGEIVTEKVLNADEINRFTMMNREHLYGKRNHFRKEYFDRVEWIVETVDLNSFTDCFVCNQGHKKVNKASILI